MNDFRPKNGLVRQNLEILRLPTAYIMICHKFRRVEIKPRGHEYESRIPNLNRYEFESDSTHI